MAISKELISEILEFRAQGHKLQDIVDATGLSMSTVHRVVSQNTKSSEPQRADPEGIDLLRTQIKELLEFKALCLKKFPELRPSNKPKIPKVGTLDWMQWVKTVTLEEAAQERKFQEEQAQYQ